MVTVLPTIWIATMTTTRFLTITTPDNTRLMPVRVSRTFRDGQFRQVMKRRAWPNGQVHFCAEVVHGFCRCG